MDVFADAGINVHIDTHIIDTVENTIPDMCALRYTASDIGMKNEDLIINITTRVDMSIAYMYI